MVNIPTTDNIPANLSDPFEPETGNSFVDIMNVDYLPQPVAGISSIDDQLGFNVPNCNLKVQIANDLYVNLGKLLITITSHLVKFVAYLSFRHFSPNFVTCKSYIAGISFYSRIHNLYDTTQTLMLKKAMVRLSRLDQASKTIVGLFLSIF